MRKHSGLTHPISFRSLFSSPSDHWAPLTQSNSTASLTGGFYSQPSSNRSSTSDLLAQQEQQGYGNSASAVNSATSAYAMRRLAQNANANAGNGNRNSNASRPAPRQDIISSGRNAGGDGNRNGYGSGANGRGRGNGNDAYDDDDEQQQRYGVDSTIDRQRPRSQSPRAAAREPRGGR